FFVNVTQTTEVCTLSLHDALPISTSSTSSWSSRAGQEARRTASRGGSSWCATRIASESSALCAHPSTGSRARRSGSRSFSTGRRSEEHTSELQSRFDLVCRLLLEK